VKDIEHYKDLTDAQRKKWVAKAMAAARGMLGHPTDGEPRIYFVGPDDGDIKIGITTNLPKRLCSLRTGSSKPLRTLLVIPGTQYDERELHRRFAADRLRGEWFKRSKLIMEFINSYRAG
jgi:hypothetical protein